MKVWLYYRLSRDEDEELNSLNNQRKIIYNFAVSNGHEVVGESFDDNVSGMHFNREGIDKIYEVVEAGKIEAIIVKDLSRLGRHRTQTALFIDYLREHDVRVQRGIRRIMAFKDNLAVDRHQDVMHFGVRIIECIQQVQYVLRGHTVGFRRGTGHHRAFFRLTVRVVIGQRWESQGKCHCGRQEQRKQLFQLHDPPLFRVILPSIMSGSRPRCVIR